MFNSRTYEYYSLLPTHNPSKPHHGHAASPLSCRQIQTLATWSFPNIPRRYSRIVITVLVGLIIYLILFGPPGPTLPSGFGRTSNHQDRRHQDQRLAQLELYRSAYPAEALATADGNPPSFSQYLEFEKHLPAHNNSLPYPDGKHAKYLFFGNRQWGVGWGNFLQELIYNTYFAYHVKRSFVFYNFSWTLDDFFISYDGHLTPKEIPLTALISGPIVGGPLGPEDANVPRAVSLDYFNQVCPKSERYIFSADEVDYVQNFTEPTASQLLERLAEKVNSIDDKCIEIPQGTHQIFNFMLFGSKRVLDIWPLVRQSPIITEFGWSPLINAAYSRNRELFEVRPTSIWSSVFSPIGAFLSSFFPSSGTNSTSDDGFPKSDETEEPPVPLSPPFPILKGVLVLHIRRSDYSKHCWHFIRYRSHFNGFNSFDELPDQFDPPTGVLADEDIEGYMKHCFPTMPQIVEKVNDVRKKVLGLKKLYIMTNGEQDWLDELKAELNKEEPLWEGIKTSRDLVLSWEQDHVSQALDMFIGARAQAFVGNGFSSMSSNIVMFRMGNPNLRPKEDTFFW